MVQRRHVRWSWVLSFQAVARYGSRTAAARSLGVSQPTIGNHLQQLECWLGFGLGSGYSPYILHWPGRQFLHLTQRMGRELGRLRLDPDSQLQDFDFEWHTYIYCLRKYRSQYAVAELLMISQSTVSRNMSAAERWLCYDIFRKDGGYETTELGECFFNVTEHSMNSLLRFREKFKNRIMEYNKFVDERAERKTIELIDRIKNAEFNTL